MTLDLDAIVTAVRPYTMVCDSGVRFAAQSAVDVVERGIPGVIVECGVWKGGCSLAMLIAMRVAPLQERNLGEKPVLLFDSFAGLPAAGAEDGETAREWQARGDHDNCRADEKQLIAAFNLFGFLEGFDYGVVKGLFEDTLDDPDPVLGAPEFSTRSIALLRLDADWYESTKACLDNLGPRLSRGALVIVDDYYAWEGCKLAVDEWLASRPEIVLEAMPDGSAAHFRMPG